MSRFMKPEGYYTVAEAAEIVGLKTSGLCYYINEGILQVDIVYYGQKPIRLISREIPSHSSELNCKEWS